MGIGGPKTTGIRGEINTTETTREMTLRSTVSRSVKYGLHFVGIWPGTPFPGLHKFYWVMSTAFWQLFQYKYMIKHFRTDDIVSVVDCMSISLPYSLLIAKLIILWMNDG